MQMRRCDNGHYFDSEKHYSCPYCMANSSSGLEKTRPLVMPNSADLAKTQPIRPGAGDWNKSGKDEQATVGMIGRSTGSEPVVGWLVCVEGSARGQDYRIRSEKNFIGRSEKMDICITGDEQISRENHAILSYDPKKNIFRLFPGDSKGLVYLNDQEVIMPSELKSGDIIELGQTKLMFVPFCSESFQWK